ncbi:hypothetical protein DOU17_06035 [Clavibacter michiganensis subsp. michiganensis]|uniref:hypothetical protein n=1 Tax=Clavibacter michiganensis TaxID=28447 RepID=UPI000B6B49CC|nr:hypothetical protein [Clavibacter michiganensis]MWJ18485.1 hypothetical protein [Clavibacter michiganensis subsp. michiganensis]OUD96687.1 hypothetical protein CMMCAS06_00715 [Clavibacter michiganensis subsp. michiganensis]OUE06521.1 hypothetical protein CMMCAS08_07070 [Clavibacter michiganensis subsp. michiganensis]
MTGDRNAAINRFVTAAVAAAREGRHPSLAMMRRLRAELAVARDPYVDPDEDQDRDRDRDRDRADWPPTSIRSTTTTRCTSAGLQAPGPEQERP